MRIAVLYNADDNLERAAPADALAVQAVRDCARAVADACRENGWTALELAAPRDPVELVGRLRDARVDVVFNLVEALDGDARLEAAVAWLLELAGLPYTGSPPRAMTLALEKPLARAVLAAQGVPVPAGVTLTRGDEPPSTAGLPGDRQAGGRRRQPRDRPRERRRLRG
ncbi:MAG: hypothetical protein KIT58_16365 [Planctomycetota bacterium]|nr:hypothetical protein [Planctomycetota bacterium]